MKITLVTGGGKGIGLATVKRFVAHGYIVVACGRHFSAWTDALNQYPNLKEVDFKECDISSKNSVMELFEYIAKRYGCIDIAINNASPKIASDGEFMNCDQDALIETINADFLGPVLCIQQELKLMGTGGCIVNLNKWNSSYPKRSNVWRI
ncbi:hypothetical protein MAH4_32010 [Sessilibacter sp. MAH4]